MLIVCHVMIHISHFQIIYMNTYLNVQVVSNHFLAYAQHKNPAEHMLSINSAKLKYSKSYKIKNQKLIFYLKLINSTITTVIQR